VGPKVSDLPYKSRTKWKMLRGIYSAIYGEGNVSVSVCVEIKGDYIEEQQSCFSCHIKKLVRPETFGPTLRCVILEAWRWPIQYQHVVFNKSVMIHISCVDVIHSSTHLHFLNMYLKDDGNWGGGGFFLETMRDTVITLCRRQSAISSNSNQDTPYTGLT
jgi:hypothetical protein